jgi:hypothetical protein
MTVIVTCHAAPPFLGGVGAFGSRSFQRTVVEVLARRTETNSGDDPRISRSRRNLNGRSDTVQVVVGRTGPRKHGFQSVKVWVKCTSRLGVYVYWYNASRTQKKN